MIPEKTNYLTNGPDGLKRLADGPELSSYRGLSIIPTRKFSMDAGTAPRDLLRRRVRVAEYYRIPWNEANPGRTFEFYDQSRDTMFRLSWDQLCAMADLGGGDDADDDDSMGGQHHQWAFSKVGRTIQYAGSTLSESVTDAVTITGGRPPRGGIAAVPAATGDGLTLPAVHCINGRRERKKRKRADVQGRQLTSRRNPGVLEQSNMSVASAMDTISNPTYHESSETFGGGIFNDPLTQDAAFYDNFKGIQNASAEIGQNFLYWCAVRSFEWGCDSAEVMIGDLEQGVASGNGDFIYGPHGMFSYSRKRARVEMIFRILFYRYAEHEALKFRTGGPGGQDIDLKNAMKLTSEQLKDVYIDGANNAARGNFDVWVLGQENALIRYLGVVNQNNLQVILDNQGIGNLGNYFIQTYDNANASYHETYRAAKFNGLYVRLSLYWPDAINRRFDEDAFNNIVKVPALKAVFDYADLLVQWNADIWMEKAYDGFVKPANVTRFMNDVTGKQAYHCFPGMRNNIIQDILSKYVNYSLESNYNNTYFTKHNADIHREQYIEETRRLKDELADDRNVWNASNMTIYDTFLHDFKYHTPAGVIASNIGQNHNFNAVFRPNLHITRCDPLTAADMDKSASSMNESTWLIQQLAGTMPLSVDMCDVLMSQANPAAAQLTRREYSRFLTGPGVGNVNRHPEDPFNTLLMHWFMSRFHPIKEIRDQAASHCILEDACKNYLAQAMSNLLRNNQTFSVELETAFKELKPEAYSDKTSFYCPGVAATTCCNLPSYVSDFDTENAAVGSMIPWYNVPVFDKEAIQPTKYTSNPVYNTVETYETFVREDFKTFQPDATHSGNRSYHAIFGNKNVESEANKVIYNPLTAEHESVANNKPLHMKLPWTYYLTSVMDTTPIPAAAGAPPNPANNGSKYRTPQVSNLTSQRFLMDANASMIDADALKQPICSNEIAYMRNDAAALCSDANATDLVLDHVLLVLVNRFWKPTARFMLNGAGMPTVNDIPEVLITNPAASMAVNVPAPAPAAPAGGNVWVVQGNGCHFSHGPRLPTVGGGGAGGGMSASDIVILRPNIEHEMLGVIMGRGGTQELGATFWGQTELSCYDDAQHGIWGMSYK